jgi:hypothetical protein
MFDQFFFWDTVYDGFFRQSGKIGITGSCFFLPFWMLWERFVNGRLRNVPGPFR